MSVSGGDVPAPSVVVRRATLDEILALRHAELRVDLPLESAHFAGDDDPATRHFGAWLAGTSDLAGCASFMPAAWDGTPAMQLRGMATRADLVRRGVGSALLRFAEAAVRDELGAVPLWCNARVPAVGFYEKLGWRVVSDVFDVPTAGPHRRMLRR